MAEGTTPRLVEPDTEEDLQRQFLENNWTDKLPIVLPTEDRVAAMLAQTSHDPSDRGQDAAHRQSRPMGIHRREGRRERGDVRRAARNIFR